MRCYGLIEDALAKNSNFSLRMLVQYISNIQICLTCRIEGMGKVESAKNSCGSTSGTGILRCKMH
jgi:hypothetical protein